MPRLTGYEPLGLPKPFGPDIWIVDGPHIRFYGLPFSTRMTIVRLQDGGLWLHSPIAVDDAVWAAVSALGPLRHIVAPNWIHYASVHQWQARTPSAITWAAPGVRERARSRDVPIRVDHVFGQGDTPEWEKEIRWRHVSGSQLHSETVFYHDASRTLILTDLIENFDPRFLPAWLGWLVRLAGITVPDGRMPPDMALSFRGGKEELRGHVEWMLARDPERVILSHGDCYDRNAVVRLRRVFAWIMRD